MTMPTIRMSTALLTAVALFAFAIAGSASAEVSELRITKQPSIIYLPLVVMEQNKLIEKMYGETSRDKLDSVTIQLGHPDAMIAVINGSSEVNSHFSAPPYQYSELKAPGVHLVLDSSDVFGGPASNAVVFGTRKFYDANPKTIAAFMAALEEADQLIARDPALAAKIYLDATKEKYSVDEIVAMIKAPNVVYSTTPNATMVFANFMFKTGLIKTKPVNWKEFFFPVAHGFPGT